MPAYLILDVDVHDPALYEDYKKLGGPTVAAYGGKYLVRGGKVAVLEGEWNPKRFVVIEFESAARARAWWDSAEYAPAKAIRQKAARTTLFIVEGV